MSEIINEIEMEFKKAGIREYNQYTDQYDYETNTIAIEDALQIVKKYGGRFERLVIPTEPKKVCENCKYCNYDSDIEDYICRKFGNSILYDMFISIDDLDDENYPKLNGVGCMQFEQK